MVGFSRNKNLYASFVNYSFHFCQQHIELLYKLTIHQCCMKFNWIDRNNGNLIDLLIDASECLIFLSIQNLFTFNFIQTRNYYILKSFGYRNFLLIIFFLQELFISSWSISFSLISMLSNSAYRFACVFIPLV